MAGRTPSRLDHFIRFGTDAAGLERLFRLLQAIAHIITSFPALLNLSVFLLATAVDSKSGRPAAVLDAVRTRRVLLDLRSRFALARRFFRIFRFLENFQASYRLYAAMYSSPPKPTPIVQSPEPRQEEKKPQEDRAPARSEKQQPHVHSHVHTHGHPHTHNHVHKISSRQRLEAYLDIFSRSFNGMYLLLETLTFADALAVPDFALWGPALEPRVTIEAQRFWFLSLVCAVAAALLKMLRVVTHIPVPPADEDEISDWREPGVADEKDSETPPWQKEQERMRRMMQRRKTQRKAWRRDVRKRLGKLFRRMVADALDLMLPGSVVGWIAVGPGTVGLAMLGSTILTGMEAWERCGQEVVSMGAQ